MDAELEDLYQEVILDHNKRPRNKGPLPDATASADGHNPLCGDKIKVHVRVEGDRVVDLRFEGAGCAISQASASTMTEAVKGLSRSEIETLFEGFHVVVTGKADADSQPGLGKLAVFSGVSEFPMRVKCATLAWHTLRAALAGAAEPVKTE